jgi:hypothetical protein
MTLDREHWQLFDITESDWTRGWRRTLDEAVNAFLEREDPDHTGEPIEIKISVRKRSRNPIHDYLVDR